jgi:hypothetical protein
MTIRHRLTLSFVTILVVLVDARNQQLSPYRAAQILHSRLPPVIPPEIDNQIQPEIDNIEKHVSLLNQGIADLGGGGARPEEIAQFEAQLEVITGQAGELIELSNAAGRATVDGLARDYAVLESLLRELRRQTIESNRGNGHTRRPSQPGDPADIVAESAAGRGRTREGGDRQIL